MTSDSIQMEAAVLMRSRKFDEAAERLRIARDEMRSRNDRREAAYIGGLLASCLTAARLDDDAMIAYREALQDDPEEPFLRFRFATFLSSVVNRPSEALEVLYPALPRLAASPSSLHSAQALLGIVHLNLGDEDKAAESFRQMSAPTVLDQLSVADLDLAVVEELVERRALVAECRRYLEVASRKAEEEGDATSLSEVRRILNKLNVPHG